MNKRKLLSLPYLIWMIGFTVIPLLMILWYGFQGKNGGFTLEHILADRKSTRLNSSHTDSSRMPSSA